MATSKIGWEYDRVIRYAGVIAWVIYLVLYLLSPNTSANNQFNLSYTQIFLLKLTVALPQLAIWQLALTGVSRFKNYAVIIEDSPEGKGLNAISNGLMLVVASFILQALIGIVTGHIVGSSLMEPVVLLHNHLPILLALIGFCDIFIGSRSLIAHVKRQASLESNLRFIFPYLILAVIFCSYFYTHISHLVTAGVPNFSVPGHWPFYTLALPSIVTWLIGAFALENIHRYAEAVTGSIYKSALRNLVRGLSVALIFSIIIQLLSLSSTFFGRFGLGTLLLIIYALLLIYALGFVFIARGAKQLTKIEVVT